MKIRLLEHIRAWQRQQGLLAHVYLWSKWCNIWWGRGNRSSDFGVMLFFPPLCLSHEPKQRKTGNVQLHLKELEDRQKVGCVSVFQKVELTICFYYTKKLLSFLHVFLLIMIIKTYKWLKATSHCLRKFDHMIQIKQYLCTVKNSF